MVKFSWGTVSVTEFPTSRKTYISFWLGKNLYFSAQYPCKTYHQFIYICFLFLERIYIYFFLKHARVFTYIYIYIFVNIYIPKYYKP